MKASAKPSDFAALIGIDWADQKHDIFELCSQNNQSKHYLIGSSAKAISDWANELREKYPGQLVAVACELKKGPLIYALEKFDHIVIFPLNPRMVAKYRETFALSGAKSDPTDAQLQTELLGTYMHKLTALFPDEPEIRALTQLTVQRRSLVQERVNLTNKMISHLKCYFPHVLEWFEDKDTLIFCEFLTRWPTLQRAKRARKATLTKFFNEHNSRYIEVNEKRIAQIKQATALTKDPGIIEPNEMLVGILIEQLKVLIAGIEKLEKDIARRFKAHNDCPPQLAPRLLTVFGSNRDRYDHSSEIQKYSGVAPVIESSGNKSWTHWRYNCPTFIRQTFIEWAGQSVRYSFWARAYYNQQLCKGKSHNTILRALAFKWIRIVFRCWKERKPYDESKYLEALKRQGSPLLEFAVNNAN